MRKIIQFAFDPNGNITALCNDGSLWDLHYEISGYHHWEKICPKIPQIPQSKKPKNKRGEHVTKNNPGNGPTPINSLRTPRAVNRGGKRPKTNARNNP